MFEVKVKRPRSLRKKRVLHAFNIPPMRRIRKTYQPKRDKSHHRRRATTRIVVSVDRAIRVNSDSPIIDPDRHKTSKADRKGFRYYTPQVLGGPFRKHARPTWDQTLQNSEAHRSGAGMMIEPFTIRRIRHGSHERRT